MHQYRATGKRTDLADGPCAIVTTTGQTPREARERLSRKYMYLTDVHTELIPPRERYDASRESR